MSIDTYYQTFLARKLGSIPFQVWLYEQDLHSVQFLISQGNKKPVSLSFQHIEQKTKNISMTKQTDLHHLYFQYDNRIQLCVCIIHPSSVLSNEEIEDLYHFLSLSLINETVNEKKKELINVINSFLSITSSLDLENVLQNIIKNALKVIPSADAGFLLLYDENTNLLKAKAPVGFPDDFLNLAFKVGESITGTVFQDGRGRIYNSAIHIETDMKCYNISKENDRILKDINRLPDAAICVPITMNSKRLGVMIIHQWHNNRKLVDDDLRLMEGFAAQAAIAIQNATYYAEANEQLLKITSLSQQLKETNTLLQKRHHVHETLTRTSLQNNGIETMINKINSYASRLCFFFII